jgi:hypothetical protein
MGGRRTIVEAKATAILRLPGLNPSAPDSISIVNIPLDEPTIDLFLTAQSGAKDRILWMSPTFGSTVQQARPRARLGISLDAPLDLRTTMVEFRDSTLQIIIIATDSFSGSRHAYWQYYSVHDLVDGWFGSTGLEVGIQPGI